ncbi:MAG TPA: hypothetical protein VNH38_07670 [Candidatus Dormibacteraeota bacterium]|nr:hypothetical protein [Candidatus Dormibacteraeota bacterium]
MTHPLVRASRASRASRSPRRALVLTTAAVAALLTLSSCGAAPNGVQKENGAAIVRAAGVALGSAHSFEILETLTDKGNTESLTFDVEGKNEGGGSFTTSSLSFQAEELKGIDYFRSKTLWDQVGGATLQAALGDRWVYLAASSATAAELSQAFAGLTAPKSLASLLTSDAPKSVRGNATRVRGQPVIAVKEPKGGTIYIATTGAPYPLRWVRGSQGSVDFRDFGKTFNLKVPKNAVNLAAILAG